MWRACVIGLRCYSAHHSTLTDVKSIVLIILTEYLDLMDVIIFNYLVFFFVVNFRLFQTKCLRLCRRLSASFHDRRFLTFNFDFIGRLNSLESPPVQLDVDGGRYYPECVLRMFPVASARRRQCRRPVRAGTMTNVQPPPPLLRPPPGASTLHY